MDGGCVEIRKSTPWGFLMYNGFYRLGMFEDVSIFGSPGWALAAVIAIGSVVILPILILVFLVQRHIVRGLTLGAVKG